MTHPLTSAVEGSRPGTDRQVWEEKLVLVTSLSLVTRTT